jgi:hypothetical protein
MLFPKDSKWGEPLIPTVAMSNGFTVSCFAYTLGYPFPKASQGLLNLDPPLQVTNATNNNVPHKISGETSGNKSYTLVENNTYILNIKYEHTGMYKTLKLNTQTHLTNSNLGRSPRFCP